MQGMERLALQGACHTKLTCCSAPAAFNLSTLLGDHKVLVPFQRLFRRLRCRTRSQDGVINHLNIAVISIVCSGALWLTEKLQFIVKGKVNGFHASGGRREQANEHLNHSSAWRHT